MKYKASDIKECVLPAVRVKAGLSSTNKFTTNISESINHAIKQEAATTSYSPSNSVSLPALSVSQATLHGQVVLGTGVNFNIHSPILQSPSVRPTLASAGGISRLGQNAPGPVAKPFTLKLKTKQIKVCQSCRKDYKGENHTLSLVVAHPERRSISNPITGAQFVGKESNSHYHAHIK